MTKEEILKLSNEELDAVVQRCLSLETGRTCGGFVPKPYSRDMNNAMDLFNEIYNPMSKIRGGAWVLGTVDDGKDCSLATLFFGQFPRRTRRAGRKNRPLKAQAKTKKKQMAKAITLCYVMAMEGATVDLQYQSAEG